MLQKTADEIARCLEHAATARPRASQTDNELLRDEYLDMAKRWESLARSFEFSDRLNEFTQEVVRRRDRGKEPGDPRIWAASVGGLLSN